MALGLLHFGIAALGVVGRDKQLSLSLHCYIGAISGHAVYMTLNENLKT